MSNETNGISWNDLNDGSILGSSGNYKDPFILMESNSVIKGFSIFYPDQICFPSSKKPLVYPPSVQINGDQVAVMGMSNIHHLIIY